MELGIAFQLMDDLLDYVVMSEWANLEERCYRGR